MDKVNKFARKLSKDEVSKLFRVIELVRSNKLAGLDCRKLKDKTNEYRVRIGRIRVKFTKVDLGNIITDVGFRDDNTY